MARRAQHAASLFPDGSGLAGRAPVVGGLDVPGHAHALIQGAGPGRRARVRAARCARAVPRVRVGLAQPQHAVSGQTVPPGHRPTRAAYDHLTRPTSPAIGVQAHAVRLRRAPDAASTICRTRDAAPFRRIRPLRTRLHHRRPVAPEPRGARAAHPVGRRRARAHNGHAHAASRGARQAAMRAPGGPPIHARPFRAVADASEAGRAWPTHRLGLVGAVFEHVFAERAHTECEREVHSPLWS